MLIMSLQVPKCLLQHFDIMLVEHYLTQVSLKALAGRDRVVFVIARASGTGITP
jgi:hypothetical protein